jgi:tetratricopeptide (TPR) repeat protein
MLDQLNDAVAYGKRCLGIAEESNFKDAEIQAYLILGNVYLSLFQRNDVVMCANKCLRIARETDNKTAEIDALYILGLAYFSLDQSDVALRYLNKSNAIALEAGAKSSAVLNSVVIKAVHSYQNMYNNGLSYLNELQKNSEKLKNDCLEEELYVNIPVEEYFSSDDTELGSLQQEYWKTNATIHFREN